MKTHIQRVFRDLERDTEPVYAYLRLLIAAVLAVLYLTSDNADPHGLLAPGLAAYGVITLVGIGLHFGPVLAGALGDESRMEYTVIGDTVNVAERLEKLKRGYDTAVVVSEDLLRAARSHPPPATWERLPVDALKGGAEEIVAYRPRRPERRSQESIRAIG